MTNILDFYTQFSQYTNPGLYQDKLKNDLPDDVKEIGFLVRKSFIHRVTLEYGNTGLNKDMRFGDMTKVPWYRQPEDDNFPTVGGILTELYRRDDRGFVLDRKEENKMILTCRFLSIVMASILKSKGIPTRARSGNAPYFSKDGLSYDHWINQYYDKNQKKWITIDVDGSLSMIDNTLNPYDLDESRFDFPSKVWLDVRNQKDDVLRIFNAKPERGYLALLWSLFYDFHCLMNNEIIYLHMPIYGTYNKFPNLTKAELEKIDNLAQLMLEPDKNFIKLKEIFDNQKDFRLVYGALI